MNVRQMKTNNTNTANLKFLLEPNLVLLVLFKDTGADCRAMWYVFVREARVE